MTDSRYPIAVLVSGSGSNLQAILDSTTRSEYPARVVVVVSDRPDVKAVDRAEAAGVPTVVVDWDEFDSRDQFSLAVCDTAARQGAAALVLAGFMRVLAPVAIDRFPGKIINIHPALLPSFPGANAVRDTLDYGVTVTGVTVHFVDEEVDHGPIIVQETVEVLPDDDESSLHARLREVEHRLYPEVIDAFASGRLAVDGRRVRWEEP